VNKEFSEKAEDQLIRAPEDYPYLWVYWVMGHAYPDRMTGSLPFKTNTFLARVYATDAKLVCIHPTGYGNLVYYATKSLFPISPAASDEGEEPTS